MFCSHCGFELEAQVKFCSGCGKPIGNMQPNSPHVQQSTPIVLPPSLPVIPESLRSFLLADLVPMTAKIRPAVVVNSSTITASDVHGEGGGSVVNGIGSVSMDIQTDVKVKHTYWLRMLDTGQEVVLSDQCNWENSWHAHADQVVFTIWLQFPELTIRDWDKKLLDEAWGNLPKDITQGAKHPSMLFTIWDSVAYYGWRSRGKQTGVYSFVWDCEGICIALTYPQNGQRRFFPVVRKSERAMGGVELCAANLTRDQNIAFDEDVLTFAYTAGNVRKDGGAVSIFKNLGRALGSVGRNKSTLQSLDNWATRLQKWVELGMHD